MRHQKAEFCMTARTRGWPFLSYKACLCNIRRHSNVLQCIIMHYEDLLCTTRNFVDHKKAFECIAVHREALQLSYK